MGSLFEELEAREGAARARVEALEVELAEVSGRLGAARAGLESGGRPISKTVFYAASAALNVDLLSNS